MIPWLVTLLLAAGPATAPSLPVPALDPALLAQKERLERLLPPEAQDHVRTAVAGFRKEYAAAPEPRDPVAIARRVSAEWAPNSRTEVVAYLVLVHAAGYAEEDSAVVRGAMHSMTEAKQRLRDFLLRMEKEGASRKLDLPREPAPEGRQDWHGVADFQRTPGLGFEYPVTPEYPPAPPAIRLLSNRELTERYTGVQRQLFKLNDLALGQQDALAKIEALRGRLGQDLATLAKRISALPDDAIRAKTNGAPAEGRPAR